MSVFSITLLHSALPFCNSMDICSPLSSLSSSSSSSKYFECANGEVTTVDSAPNSSNLASTVEKHLCIQQPNGEAGQPCYNNRKRKKGKKTKKRVPCDASSLPLSLPSPSQSSASPGKFVSVRCRRRNPKVLIKCKGGSVNAIGLPLGMSFAAIMAQVLYKSNAASERISPDQLSEICTSAVKESLANVYGNKLDGLSRNFEQSFESTFKTLQLIYESSFNKEGCKSKVNLEAPRNCAMDSATQDCQSEAVVNNGGESQYNSREVTMENTLIDSINNEVALFERPYDIVGVSPVSSGTKINNSLPWTFEKSVVEQARCNDLKELELNLTMKKLKLKETQLALNFDSNHIQRSKLAVGRSKVTFQVEKFKNQLEDTRHAELLKKCIDCLVASLLLMSSSLLYGAYVFSYERISEATASCTPTIDNSWSWSSLIPGSSLNSRLQTIRCHVQVMSRMLFGVLMIAAIAFLLVQRSTISNQTMPVTFILLLLGAVCGFAGKLCVDTLGGNGYTWLFYWEILCLLHFLSNIWTSVLYTTLHGSVILSQNTRRSIFPYWIRRVIFYAAMLLVLPLCCGLHPFASYDQWKEHFLLKTTHCLTLYGLLSHSD